MKKILVSEMTDNYGGVEAVIMNYVRNISKNNLSFDFISFSSTVICEDEIKKWGSKVFYIKRFIMHPILHKQQIKKIFKNNKYDAIWVNRCDLTNIELLKIAKKYNVPTRIIHSHNSKMMDKSILKYLKTMLHKKHKREITKYATEFWSCSEEASDWMFTKEVLSSPTYKIINNAIDLSKYKFNQIVRNKYRKELGLENCFVIGNVGRLHFQKNQSFALDVFKEIYSKDKSARFVLVGIGEDEQMLKEKVNQLGLSDVVVFLGLRDDVQNILQAMDVFLFPSIFEGLSVVLFEVQASGLPVVASDCLSSESKILQNFVTLSLDAPIIMWVDACFVNKNKAVDRVRGAEVMLKSKYNIESEAKKMESFFEINV